MSDLASLRVSVVIPVYNGAAFIARAVRSVLAQGYRAAEVIVVDDGSTDGTGAALAGFGRAIRLVRIPNGGVSNARNVGIRASTCPFIAFLDADDVWDPDKLRRQVQVFADWPGVGLVCCDFLTSDGTGSGASHFATLGPADDLVFDRPLPGSALPPLIRRNVVGTSSNVMVRRDVLGQAGFFDPCYRQAEDYDLWLRCAIWCRFVLLAAPLVTKYKHGGNLTNNWLETLECHERVLLALPRQAGFPAACLALVAPALAAIRHEIGDQQFERGRILKAFGCYTRGLGSDMSMANICRSLGHMTRKTVRLLSLGAIRRHRNDADRASPFAGVQSTRRRSDGPAPRVSR